MAIELIEYKIGIIHLVETIKNVLGADLIVVDKRLTRIINTFQYEKNPVDIRLNSVVGNILVEGKSQVVKDRKDYEACKLCPEYRTCELEEIIGVPIECKGERIGAIAMLLRSNQVNILGRQTENAVEFLNEIGKLIASQIEKETNKRIISNMEEQFFYSFDRISSQVLFLDNKNKIISANRAFQEFFDIKNQEITGHDVDEFLLKIKVGQSKRGVEKGELFYSVGHGLIQLRNIEIMRESIGRAYSMYIFRFADARRLINRFQIRNIEDTIREFFGPSEEMRKAKEATISAMQNELPILIEGNSNVQTKRLARKINDYITDGKWIPVSFDCQEYGNELETVLFGEETKCPGILSPPRGGVISLLSIHEMPLFLQRKLYECVINNQCMGRGNADIRLIVTSSEDLVKASKKGKFLPELLQVVSRNRIKLPDIRGNEEDIRFYFTKYLREYEEIYHHDSIILEDNFWEELMKCDWIAKISTLQKLAEVIVSRTNKKTIDSLQEYTGQMYGTDVQLCETTVDFNREAQLRALLLSGKNKKEIAEKMGIGRATLYRWMERYHLEV